MLYDASGDLSVDWLYSVLISWICFVSGLVEWCWLVVGSVSGLLLWMSAGPGVGFVSLGVWYVCVCCSWALVLICDFCCLLCYGISFGRCLCCGACVVYLIIVGGLWGLLGC